MTRLLRRGMSYGDVDDLIMLVLAALTMTLISDRVIIHVTFYLLEV